MIFLSGFACLVNVVEVGEQGAAELGVLLDKTRSLMGALKALVLVEAVAVKALEVMDGVFLRPFDRRGCQHGADLRLDLEDIQSQVEIMLTASPVEGAEEYAIHDFEGFDGYSLGEYEGLEKAHEIASFIEEYPEFGGALLAHFNDIDEARKAAEEDYCGCYASLADYAQDLTEETSNIPPHLANYIDYTAMARDMEYGGDVFTLETGFEQVHVFWNR